MPPSSAQRAEARRITKAISEVGFVPHFQEIDVEYDPGTTINVQMHDGSQLRLRKLHDGFDPTDRVAATTAPPRRSCRPRCRYP